jgi:leucine-rich repeat protein SHOC2
MARSLCELKATGNKLSDIPQSIGELGENLEVLDLKGNQIRRLPDAQFGRLSRLLKLNLDENQLTYIPYCFVNLTFLTDLSIAKNRLQDVQDDALHTLKNLVSLDLHQNQFERFYSVP